MQHLSFYYILFLPIQPRCHYTPRITITWETMIWNNHVRATNEYYHRQYVAHFMLSQDRWHRCACKSMAAKWGFNIGYPSHFLVTTCVSNAFSNSCYWWFILFACAHVNLPLCAVLFFWKSCCGDTTKVLLCV